MRTEEWRSKEDAMSAHGQVGRGHAISINTWVSSAGECFHCSKSKPFACAIEGADRKGKCMGANVDIDIFTTEYVGITPILQCLSRYHDDIRIDDIRSIDDWPWNGEKIWGVTTSPDDIQDLVMKGKIVWIYLQTQGDPPLWRGGCKLQQISTAVFQMGLFLNTANREYFVSDELITARNHGFFDRVTDEILLLAQQIPLIGAGMGIETSVDFKDDIISTISSAISVNRWIAPARLPLSQEYYVEQHFASAYIYTTMYHVDDPILYIPDGGVTQ